MSAASRAAEAEEAVVAYQLAITELGVRVVAEALVIWLRMMPMSGGTPATDLASLREVGRAIRRSRKEARALARSYYRLSRALSTGSTVAPVGDKRTTVRLNELRLEFSALAGRGPRPNDDNPLVQIEPLAGYRQGR